MGACQAAGPCAPLLLPVAMPWAHSETSAQGARNGVVRAAGHTRTGITRRGAIRKTGLLINPNTWDFLTSGGVLTPELLA